MVFGAGGLVGVGEDPAAEGHLAAMCMKKKTRDQPDEPGIAAEHAPPVGGGAGLAGAFRAGQPGQPQGNREHEGGEQPEGRRRVPGGDGEAVEDERAEKAPTPKKRWRAFMYGGTSDR